MLKKLLITLGILVGIVVVAGLFLPTEFQVSRAVVIDAKPETIHAYVGDLKKWNAWEPWRDADPSLAITIGEKSTGVGAAQSWIGKEGDGSLVFTESSPDKGVRYDLFFLQGKERCTSSILYNAMQPAKTNVLWTMKGDMEVPVLGGYMAMFMDSMVGPLFEQGLAKLKRVAEAG